MWVHLQESMERRWRGAEVRDGAWRWSARLLGRVLTLGLVAAHGFLSASGQSVEIENASFESPVTDFVTLQLDGWEKRPKPEGFEENEQFVWDQLVGIFLNTPEGSDGHIPNTDGDQGLFLFNVPAAGFSQSLDAAFEVGQAYALTAGLIGGGGGMFEGASVRMELFFIDENSAPATVAATDIVHSLDTFPTTTLYVDQTLVSDPVGAADPWAGEPIGIRFTSTTRPDIAAGFWDIDHVRLTATSPSNGLREPEWRDGEFRFTLVSAPDLTWEILWTEDLGLPIDEWNLLRDVTVDGSSVTVVDEEADGSGRSYIARVKADGAQTGR